MNINDRLRQLIDYKDVSNRKFATDLGISSQRFGHYLAGREPDYDTLKRIIETNVDISADWLLTGRGEMLNSTTIPAVTQDISETRLIPLYSFDAVAGMHGINDFVDTESYIERYIPFIGAKEGDICIQVTGDSMTPTYCSGTLLQIREVEGWREYFGYGHCFVLMLADGRRILKKVQKYIADPANFITCISYNDNYPPEELPKSFILRVYKVIRSLTEEGF